MRFRYFKDILLMGYHSNEMRRHGETPRERAYWRGWGEAVA
jgi:hypothetical protein